MAERTPQNQRQRNRQSPPRDVSGSGSAKQEEDVDPADNLILTLLVVALLACLISIVLVIAELNSTYGVEFGGILSADASVAEQVESENSHIPKKPLRSLPENTPDPGSTL